MPVAVYYRASHVSARKQVLPCVEPRATRNKVSPLQNDVNQAPQQVFKLSPLKQQVM
jgi:hypothetical protein